MLRVLTGNGVMEYYEFVDLMSRVPWGEQGSEQELSGAVHSLFDHEHDGLASLAQVRRLLTSVGEPLTDEELDMMTKHLNPDGDGKVTCEGKVYIHVQSPVKVHTGTLQGLKKRISDIVDCIA